MIGTDKDPPFTLARVDYPADLDLTYPEKMYRGLVLEKWLLALPHLIIVGLLVGGYSMLNLLVVLAGFFLLVTGTYPSSFFDFLMGINHWMHRVLIHVALMTDEYPPFRLDAGAAEGDRA